MPQPAFEHPLSRRTMFVVLVDCSFSSIRHVPSLIPMRGRAVVAWVLDRLRGAFGDQASYFLLCRSPHLESGLAKAVGQAAEIVTTEAAGFLEALAEVGALEDAGTVAVVPSIAALLDCELTRHMLERHWTLGAQATIALNYPPGLVPDVFERTTILESAGTQNDKANWHQFRTALAKTIAGSGSPLCVDLGDELRASRDCERLPESALVADSLSRDAAKRVLSEPAVSSAAVVYAFKESLLDLRAERPRHSAVGPTASKPVVIFSSLQMKFSGGEESLYTLISNLDRFSPVGLFPFATRLAERLTEARIPTSMAGWEYSNISPHNLAFCEAVLDTYDPALIHIDGHLNPALMTVAWARGIPMVGHLRTFAGPELPEIAWLVNRFITVSKAVASDLRRRNIEPWRVVPIHNAVDLSRFLPSRFDREELRRKVGIEQTAPVICVVTRIAPEKRLEVLLSALPLLLKALPALQVLIVGEAGLANSEYESLLRRQIEAGRLEPHVRWWGFEEEIAKIYAIADALVLPSDNEPFGRCIIEALAMGLPVVAANQGGPPEQIVHGVTGMLFEPNSAESLAAAVKIVFLDTALRSVLTANARRQAEQFTPARHVAAVQGLYQQVLEEAHAARQRGNQA